MKATAQKVATTQKSHRRSTNSGVLAKIRTGQGNHHRADSLELQAEQLASRVSRGESGVARHVSTTAASDYRPTAGIGQPLPRTLRESMEGALGADLREVRIHSGTAANLATEELEAEAIASGRNIYFRRGRFSPNSAAGRHLIAHELVHVLQQTGRTSADGRLKATNLTGSGLVQCKPGDPPPTPLSEKEQKDLFDKLVDRYKPRSTQTDVEATINDVRTLLGGRLDPNKPEFAKAFRDSVNAKTFQTKSGEARGFVLDCLKAMGFYPDAYLLLDRDTKLEIKVSISVGDFFEFLRTPPRGDNWVGEALRHTDLREFWPTVIVRGYRDFLLQPHSPPPGENTKLRDRVQVEEDRRVQQSSSTELVPQERVLLAWQLLHSLDAARVEECGQVQSESGVTTATLTATESRQRVLMRLKASQQEVVDNAEAPPYKRLLAEKMMTVVNETAPIWEGTMAAYISWQSGFQRFTDEELLKLKPEKFPHSSLTNPFLQTLRKILVPQTQSLLALIELDDNPAEFPSPEIYQQRLSAFRESLSQNIPSTKGKAPAASVFQQLDEALSAAARAKKPVKQTIQALSLLSLILDKIVQLSLNYDRVGDEATPSFVEERAAHRIMMARSLGWVARWMQWDDLLLATDAALTADFTGDVQLWLVSEWEPEPRQPIDRLAEDFRKNENEPIIRDTPLTVRHLVDWFHLDYNTRLRATLEELVRPEERATAKTEVDVERINALRQSREEVRGAMSKSAELELLAEQWGVSPDTFDLRIPQRFVVKNFEFVSPLGKQYEWDRVIEDAKKTKLSLARHRADGDYSIIIFPTNRAQGVFAWMLPSIRPLVALLRRLGSLKRKAGDSDVDDATWLKGLAPEQLSEADWADVNRRIRTRLEDDNKRVKKDLPELWLRFNILRRRILVMQLRPALQAFGQNRSVAFGPGGESKGAQAARLMAPTDTTTAIMGYEAAVTPPTLAPVQTTLMLLGLADLLEGVVTENDPQAEFGRRIYPYLLTALDFLGGDAEKLQQLREGTNSFDEAGSIVYIESNLKAATKQLANLKTAIDNSYRAAQEDVGFSSENGKTIKPIKFATEIYPSHKQGDIHEWGVGMTLDKNGQIDTTSGTRYRLIEVYRKFTYHPALGSQNGMGPGVAARYINESGVEYPRQNERGEIEPIPHVPLFRFEINGKADDVFADDGNKLYVLNDAFLWRSFQIQMENLAYMSEEYMKWVVAVVATIVPGVTYAEIATTAMQFIISGELEEIVHQIRNDPGEVLQRIIERLRTELFTPENIWRYVLLGGQHSPFEALRDIVPSRPKQRTSVQPSSRLGRIVLRLRQLGQRIRDVLHKLRLYADGPIRSVQGFIAMRPTLAWLLRRAAHLIEAAIDLIPPTVVDAAAEGKLPATPQELIDVVKNGIENTTGDMEKSVVRLLETIHHFELPYELLDLGAATEIILGFIADRFGPRARLVRMVLQIIPIPQEHEGRFTGMKTLYQAICGEIAKVWKDTPIDPNLYWREDVLPLIGTKFTETRDDLVDGLYGTVDALLKEMGQPALKRPGALPETIVEAVEEVEASFSSESSTSADRDQWRVRAVGGSPLPTSMRRSFESGFGEQFSHVRLHQGPESYTATQPIGADAVTSGSHVFLAPSKSASSSVGRRLLGHELTHVVQQTGSHPLGSSSRPAVRTGRPQRGLLLDSSRERQADDVAGRFVSGRPIPKLGGATFNGAQPALGERLVNSVIDTITVAKKSSDFTETPHGGSAAHVPGIELCRSLWKRVLELVNEAKFADFLKTPPGSTEDVAELIKKHLKERSEELIGSQIGGIAQLAQRPKPNRQPNDPETELNPARFINLLEDFIAAERGIGIEISFNETEKTVSQIKVHNVLLANIGGTSSLWNIVMQASFGSHSTDVPDLSAAKGEIRQRLRSLPPTPLVFAFTSFQFSSTFVNDYLDLVRSRGRGVDDILPVTEYTDTTNKRGDSLAISTHGELTGKARSIGTFKRESHHTTQYLLVEYFGNDPEATRFAFPSHHARYSSGVEFQTGNNGAVKGIRSGGRYLDIAGLTPSGRGNSMPAILISARTHQRGELHVLREAKWEPGAKDETENKGTPTQGFAIENTFNRNLPPDLRPSVDTDAHKAVFKEAIDKDDARANREFYNAAKATYHWMYNRMIPALQSGLLTEELAYYRGVASLKHKVSEESAELAKPYDMKAENLTPVWRKAKANNDRLMSAAGWPTP